MANRSPIESNHFPGTLPCVAVGSFYDDSPSKQGRFQAVRGKSGQDCRAAPSASFAVASLPLLGCAAGVGMHGLWQTVLALRRRSPSPSAAGSA